MPPRLPRPPGPREATRPATAAAAPRAAADRPGEPRSPEERRALAARLLAEAAAAARTPRPAPLFERQAGEEQRAGRRGAALPRPEPTPVERALRLISARARTATELDRALLRAKVPAAERASALARMRELGYIDDAALATTRAQRLVGRGDAPRLVQQRLRAQGVDAEAARAAARAAAAGATEEELASRALQRKLRGRRVVDAREKERLLRALVQKGHRPSAVAKALELEWDGDDGVDADE
jgi:regulatory protein